MRHRERLHRFFACLAALGFIVPVGGVSPLAPLPARAFELSVHERIVRQALAGQVEPWALDRVVAGNEESDLHQFAPERHFDNATGPGDICTRWQDGVRTFLDRAVTYTGPADDRATVLTDREGALRSFGEMSHALQDFYAHSNWIELQFAAGQSPGKASALVAQECDAARLPAALQTGYFNLGNGPDGCPSTGPLGTGAPAPPAPFSACHEQLAKDHPDKGHGADKALDGRTFHDIAVALATQSTTDAWELLHAGVVERYTDATMNGQCLFEKLAFGGETACRCPSGGLTPRTSDARLVAPSAERTDAGAEQSAAEMRHAQIAAPSCSGTGTITYERTATYQFEKVTPTPNGSITDHDRRSSTTRVSVTLDGDRAQATVSETSVGDTGQVIRGKDCTTTFGLTATTNGAGSGAATVNVVSFEGTYQIHVRAPRVQTSTVSTQTLDAAGCPDAELTARLFGVQLGTTSKTETGEENAPSDIDAEGEYDATNPPSQYAGSRTEHCVVGDCTTTMTWSVTAGSYEVPTRSGESPMGPADDTSEDEGD
jgi:hypothetical protein